MQRCVRSPAREWLHPERFRNEPIYCEALHSPDDVLCPGSDDEAYDSPAERRLRCEIQARRFIEGKPLVLLSASLAGPFDRKSGWVNPWRSKSAARAHPARRRPPPASRRAAADHNASAGPFDPANGHRHAPPRYMDHDAFSRVLDWRDRVLAEAGPPATPARRASPTEPASADSRLATRQTASRHAAMTPTVPDDDGPGGGSAPPDTPLAGKQKKHREVPSSAQATASRGCPNPCHLALSKTISFASRTGPISEQADLPGQTTRAPSPPRSTAEDALAGGAPAERAPSAAAPADKQSMEGNHIATPAAVLPEVPSSARPRTQPSARTDGSFRYRRRDFRGEGPALARNGLSDASSASDNTDDRPVSDHQPAPKPLPDTAVSVSVSRSSAERRVSGTTAAGTSEAVHEGATVAVGGQQQKSPGDGTRSGASQHVQEPSGPATDQGRQEEEADDTPSQMDGPTLVPSDSMSDWEPPSMPSFGHFSCENGSQDIPSEAVGLPRRLLWPKSERGGSRASLPVFGPDLERAPDSQRSEPARFDFCRSIPTQPTSPTREPEPTHPSPTEQPAAPVRDRCEIENQKVEKDPQRVAEGAPDSETQSEAESACESQDVPKTEQRQTGTEGNAGPGTQQASPVPAPQIQSPWVKEEAALLPAQTPDRRVFGSGGEENSEARSGRPPGNAQSPWTKDADTLAPLPVPHLSNAALSSIASQALQQAASQSPWQRGDSQMQVPQVRLFNPLSSPAHSVGLPAAADDLAQSRKASSGCEDIDMCNSQPLPPRPSTPEAKQSGLQTPDFSLSVRSFKDFMTPSPQPAAKRRRISPPTITDEHLPSTQALIDAAVSNPWARTSSAEPRRRKQKRVSWAPLPDEDSEPGSAPALGRDTDTPSATPTPTAAAGEPAPRLKRQRRSPRSPPPPSLSATTTAAIPTAHEKFAGHFAAVLRPPRHTPDDGPKRLVRLLPSESQQVCGSPAFEAMAEAFIMADRGGAAAASAGNHNHNDGNNNHNHDHSQAGHDGDDEGCSREAELEQMEVDRHHDADDGDDDGHGKGDEEDEDGEEEEPVDDVSAVMQNLDDFLGSWDIDAELAKARAESGARENRPGGRGILSGAGAAVPGLMDVGVWDC